MGIMTLFINMSYSQVNIAMNTNNISTINDLWNIGIVSMYPNQQIVDVELTVYSEDETVLYKGNKTTIVLQPSLNISITPTSDGIHHDVTDFPKNDTLQQVDASFIPNGNYVLCVSVFAHEPKVELNRSCEFITVKNSYLDSLLISVKGKVPKAGIQVHSTVEIFSYIDVYSQPTPTTLQHRNTGIFLNPSVELFGYPLNMSIFYDTDSDFYYSNIPTFQFNFDTKAYQQILQERLQSQLASKSPLSPEKYQEAMTMITSLEDFESITNNPYFQQEVARLDSLKVYEKYLNDSAALTLVQAKIQHLDTLSLEQMNNDSLCLDSTTVMKQTQLVKDSLIAIQDSITNTIAAGKEIIEKAKRYDEIIQNQALLEEQILADSNIAEVKAYYDKFNGFDASTLSNPNLITAKLKEIDQLKKIEGFITGFESLQFGANVPNYSELSITSVLLNGLNVNYAIGNCSVIAVAGRINDNSTFFKPDREQRTFSKLYVAGFEQQITTNSKYGLFVLQSDFSDQDSLSFYNFLEKNNTIAGKFSTGFFKNKLKAEGEIAISYAENKDIIGFEEVEEEVANVPNFWLLQSLVQKDDLATGTFTDKAAILSLSSTFFQNKTTVAITGRYVGTGFYTPGNPFLINDLMNVEFGVDQSLFKNKLQLSAHVIKNQDNLEQLKEVTTSYYNLRAGMKLRIPKYPMISIDYLPNVIINEFDQIQVNTLSAITAYNYRLGNIPCLISFNYMDIQTLSAENDSTNFNSRYYNILNNFNFKKFDIQTCFNYNEAVTVTEAVIFSIYSVGTRFSATKWMDVYANFQLTGNEHNNYEPGGQLELDFSPLATMKLKTGFYVYPESTLDYMTNIQNISNTSIYISATYNF